MTEQYEMMVIGAGAAGSAAAHAVPRGTRVIQVERDQIGGTCLNYGCDPTKTLIRLGQERHQERQGEQVGLAPSCCSFDWQRIQAYVQSVINQMRGGTSAEAGQQLRQQGIDFLAGQARFVSPHEVAVDGRVIEAERIVLATGCRARVPDIDGLRETGFITNVEAVSLPALPGRLAIIGGGAIGIEFAQLFQRFNVRVTVLEKSERLLDKEDAELVEILNPILAHEGIEVRTGVEVFRVQPVPGGKKLIYRHAQQGTGELVVDEILVALGRRPTLETLDLLRAGVRTTPRGIEVEKTLRTSVPHIWAAGDVATPYHFTHVAHAQGLLAARNAFADHPEPFDDRVVPWITFTDPPLAHVGSTEEELRQSHTPYRTARLEYKTIERALILGQPEGLIKLLVDEQGRLLGAHLLGPRADEMLAPLALAMHSELPVAQLAATLLPYPTVSEGLRWAAGQVA